MANQNKLKAWVRYDGTNTVVTAGPIFRASKPKVGNWRQINADLCCGGNTPSTTTTTTTVQSGPTVTSWTMFAYQSSQDACAGFFSSVNTVYTQEDILGQWTTIWKDAALTQPVNNQEIQGSYLTFVEDIYNPNSYWNMTGNGQATFIYNPTSC